MTLAEIRDRGITIGNIEDVETKFLARQALVRDFIGHIARHQFHNIRIIDLIAMAQEIEKIMVKKLIEEDNP